MALTITISGLHGTGKSTYAKILSKYFRLRHISAGDLFRQIAKDKGISIIELSKIASISHEIDSLIDERTKKEAEIGNVIIEGLLAGWLAGSAASIKFHLVASEQIRIERIARRDKLSYDEARKATLLREMIEKERFKKVYKLNIDDYSIYDLVLNTGLLSLKMNVGVIRSFIQEYVKLHGGK
jgi:cytidylate kinase